MKLKVLAIVLLLAVGGAAVFVAIGGLPRSAAAATTFLTATAAVTDVSHDVAATGNVGAATTWSLAFGSAPTTASASDSSASDSSSSNGSGDTWTWTVGEVKVKVGDAVKSGEVLATATNPTLAAQVVAARNDVTSAHLQLDGAQESYDNASGDSAVRQARVGLLNATNAYAEARTSLADLQKTAARSSLAAPADGVVTAVNIAPGAEAPSGAAITIDGSTYQVTADVVETDVAAIRLGQAAAVSVAAIGASLAGNVTSIAPTAESSSSSSSVVSYAVTIDLASPRPTIRSGMTADITITTASASGVLAVPAAAIRGTAGSYTVLVLANGVTEARPVAVGLMTSDLVEVRSGIAAGDQVVIGTSSQQSTTGNTFGPGGGTFVGPGGGGGGGRLNGGGGGG